LVLPAGEVSEEQTNHVACQKTFTDMSFRLQIMRIERVLLKIINQFLREKMKSLIIQGQVLLILQLHFHRLCSLFTCTCLNKKPIITPFKNC
jgi:hypothetical protein